MAESSIRLFLFRNQRRSALWGCGRLVPSLPSAAVETFDLTFEDLNSRFSVVRFCDR